MRVFTGRRFISLFLAAAFLVSALTGCGGYALKKSSDNEPVAVAKADSSTIFTEIPSPLQQIKTEAVGAEDDMGEDGIMYSSTFAKNGKYYTLYSNMGVAQSTYLSVFDADGKNASNLNLPVSSDSYVCGVSADTKGNIYMIAEDTDKKGNMIYVLRCLGDKQKEVWSVSIKADTDFWPLGMISTDSFTAVLSDLSLFIFDNKKGEQKKIALPDDSMMAKVCTDSKGNILLVGWPKDKLTVWSLDSKTFKWNKTKTAPAEFYFTEGVASGSGKYDFYIAKEEGVFGFRTDGSKPVKIVDFQASGQQFIEITGLAMLTQESALVLSYDDDMNSIPTLLKKADQQSASQIKTLTIGCLRAPFTLKDDVYKYNKRSQKYKIRIVEYSPTYQDVGALNAVISTGDVPDILCVSDEIPVESYVEKGVFEDMEPYFRADAEISGRQYLENILDAYRIRGRMYFITPSFSLMGLVGKKKDFDTESDVPADQKGQTIKGVSIDQIDRKIKQYNMKYEKALGIVTSTSVLSWITDYSTDQFVDLEKGKCRFDSEEFINLLKFAKKFPMKYRNGIFEEDSSAWVRNNEQLMSEFFLTSVNSYQTMRYGMFGEDIVFTGFPGYGNSGPVIYCPFYMAVCSDSDDKDACWDYLREYYLDEYQYDLESYFPVNRKALDQMLQRATIPEFMTYTDEEGNIVTEQDEDYYYVGNSQVTIPTASEKDISQIRAYIEEACQRSVLDQHIASIIREETGAYLKGQKSAEQTAEIIQRRVNIYVKEIM